MTDLPWRLTRPYRFYFGAVACGMTVGISWTISLTDTSFSRHLTHRHALEILWGAVAMLMTFQSIYLIREGRRLKRELAQLKRFYDHHPE